ncbi:MAG TPA: ferritin-like domain-containing protein [Acidimicrobiales bacterium]|nr:ferritin-like domain-containing protein [Acidimicrobiales bacterium]
MADVSPKIVVAHRKELSYLLCQAAEIEHMAMCQYLYAAFSLRTEPGPGLTAAQLERVERWRKVITSIASEEMLHWALVNNLLTAIGSAPFMSRPNLPHRAKGYPPSVQFALLPFGEAALRHFVYFERPNNVDVVEVAEFAPADEGPAPMTEHELQPRGQDYVSQGDLYRALDEGLERLAERLGEDGLFIGPDLAQVGPASFGWSGLTPVTDLASAKVALARIIEQGEGGSSLDLEVAHYGRFRSMLDEYLAMRGQDPTFEPAHPVAAASARTVEGEQPSGPMITDPTTRDVSDLFNAVNDLVLQVLSRYFSFGEETREQLGVLADVAFDLMVGAINPLGGLLAVLPVGDNEPGMTAGANFQLAYRSNFLLPHQRVAWVRFAERLDEAASFASSVNGDAATQAVLSRVAEGFRRNAGSLRAHLGAVQDQVQATPTMGAPGRPHIEIEPSGPYVVYGGLPMRRMRVVRSAEGEPLAWEVTERLETREVARLCRCGASATKPFCDNSHRDLVWESQVAVPTSTYRQRAKVIEGEGLLLADDHSLCTHAGFCKTRLTNVWDMVRNLSPDDSVTKGYIMAVVERCPSGTLTYRLDPDHEDVEANDGPAIGVIDDGPLFVTGDVPVGSADGEPLEIRNRMTLCRCGASDIKPLCDGTHTATGFRDS